MRGADESSLPQIVGLFYATFDPNVGPTVLYQVPERLISSGDDGREGRDKFSRNSSRSPSRSQSRARRPASVGPSGSTPAVGPSNTNGIGMGGPGHTAVVPAGRRASSRDRTSTVRGASGRTFTLLDFAPISEYVIPKKALHGKLVTFCATGAWDEGYDSDMSSEDSSDEEDGDEKTDYRIMGLPSVIEGEAGRYQRNQYMWNLCFVFRASASLEAFEPVVRKTARILRSAELDSRYLSAPSPDQVSLQAVLEQLFEDLNSYSETSIPLDGFNSLEIKLFPFYPNPPEVNDWDVPIPLVDFNALKDDYWDITASRVSQHINGIHHSAKIAQLADADLALTRETLRHMLFYQVIMMVDIFQYSNMYTVTSQFPRLCADESVIAECGAYVTHSGYPIADWPTLAALYTYLQPGRTINKWAEAHELHSRGIDPRRFVTFGIIKGFLRRVHRWPVIVDRTAPLLIAAGLGSSHVGLTTATTTTSGLGSAVGAGPPAASRRRVGFQSSGDHRPGDRDGEERDFGKDRHRDRGDSAFTIRSGGSTTSIGLAASPDARSGDASPPSGYRRIGAGSGFGRSLTSHSAAETHPSVSSRRTGTLRSGTLAIGVNARAREGRLYELEDELLGYLDGHHHTDEIQVRMGMGWAQLEKVLGLDEMRNGVGKKGVGVVYK